MAEVCNRTDCTLSQTGKCMFDRDPNECEDRVANLVINDEEEVTKSRNFLDPILQSPVENARFKATYTLSVLEAEALMRKRYCRVIGILGTPGVGKTACLVSFYLLLSRGRLEGYSFRDSKTLRALEEISRGARRWDEANSPDQLTLHTEIQDERTAGFLHFRICQTSTNNIHDLLLPDLPGEWTTSLIDDNRIDRLSFLKSTEHLLIFASGSELADNTKRRLVMHRLNLLLDRLVILCSVEKPKISLVVTHGDTYQVQDPHIAKFISKTQDLGFETTVVNVASFSSVMNIQAGHGIADLINQMLSTDERLVNQAFWPNDYESNICRQIYNFGKE